MSQNNPYAAPRATVGDVRAEAGGRPVVVWIIVIMYALGFVGGIASTFAALLGQPLGGEEAARLTGFLTPLDHLLSLVLILVNGYGTVELFRLKRRALLVFAGAFAATVLIAAFNFAFRPAYREMFEYAGYWGLAGGWTFNLVVLAYLWRLSAKGVLRS